MNIKMGHRAKHLTNAERQSAKQEGVHKGSSTPSAKLTRATLDHARYLSRRTRKEANHPSIESSLQPAKLLALLPLDSEIEHLASVPLPDSHPLFREALRKADALDESDLGRWKVEPPFFEDDDASDPYSHQYLHFTQSLASVLHGVRLRKQNERDVERRTYFKMSGKEAAVRVLRAEVADLLTGWERVKAICTYYNAYHNSRECSMYQHFIQWQARTIYHLYHMKFLE
ncbi:hypothetical protein B0H17DRAFT_1147188 [Mycena rosella]|uniref:Uncharacterized protein n=1 Tax=Mycena rosella TaxID=1033263 RepID=A0AAD7G2M4_MYCRO|nr:hypothetical protein B0H17DRAFT_1147188 [Mycena rosella]